MATVKTLYGADAQAITITLGGLAASTTLVGREATAVDNTTNLFLDALVTVKITLANGGTIGGDKKVYIYAAGTVDAATPTWPDTVTGSDAGITLNNPTQLKLIGVIECASYVTVSNVTFISEPMSVAQAFGGILPEKWSIVVINNTNIAFTAGEADKKKIYQGIQAQTV